MLLLFFDEEVECAKDLCECFGRDFLNMVCPKVPFMPKRNSICQETQGLNRFFTRRKNVPSDTGIRNGIKIMIILLNIHKITLKPLEVRRKDR